MVGERLRKGIDFAKSLTSEPTGTPKKQPKLRKEKEDTFHERVDYYCSICNDLVGSKKQKIGISFFTDDLMKITFGTDEDAKNLRVCEKCGLWVCDGCWNDKMNDCDKCSPIPSPEFRKDYYRQYFFECKKCGREFGPGYNKKEGRKFLTECHKCNRWVCGDCYNETKGSCALCEPLPQTSEKAFEGSTQPEMRIDKSTATPKYFFLCSKCRNEVGYGMNPQDAIKYLTQCPDCDKWYCITHWNSNKMKCLNCGPSYPPETRTSSSALGSKVFFMCSKCKKEIGSVPQKKWKAGDEKKYLTQCESCGKWVCGDCWNSEISECSKCSPFTPPEIRTTVKAKKSSTYFICHKCRNEFGPYEERDWVAIAKLSYNIGRVPAGIVMQNPFDVVLGIIGTVSELKSDGATKPIPSTITAKELEKLKTKDLSKKFLAPCPKCNKWVCRGCWNAEIGECTICTPCSPDKTAAAISEKQDDATQSEMEFLEIEEPLHSKATVYLINVYSNMKEYRPVYSPLGFYLGDKDWNAQTEIARLKVVGSTSSGPMTQPLVIMECKYVKGSGIHKQVIEDMEHAEQNKNFSAVCYVTDSADEAADFIKSYKHPNHSIYLYDLINDRIILNENDEKTILFSGWFTKEGKPEQAIELLKLIADRNGNFLENRLINIFGGKERECKKLIKELLDTNKIVEVVPGEYTFIKT